MVQYQPPSTLPTAEDLPDTDFQPVDLDKLRLQGIDPESL